MRRVRRYLLFFSVVAVIAIAGDLIVSELLRTNPAHMGAVLLAIVVGLPAAVMIKEGHLGRVILRMLGLVGLDLALLVIIVASQLQPTTDEASRIVPIAILSLILLLWLRRHLTLRWVLGVVATTTIYLLMAIALLYAVYLACVVKGIGIVAAYAIIFCIAVLISPPALRARVIGLFAWIGVGSATVWMAFNLAGRLSDSAPHVRGGIALFVILTAFVLVNLLRFHTVDVLVARLGNWLRG